jgi:NitT/TauT family transport system substrate-binding protein
MKARLLLVALGLGLILLGSAAGWAQTVTPPAKPIPIKVAVLGAGFVYFTPYVAADQGFFKKWGLDAELVTFRSGNEATTAVVSGSTEFGALATEHVVQVQSKGVRLKAIVANLLNSPYALIVRKEVPLPSAALGFPAVVRDLKGLKCGVTGLGASTDFTLRFALQQAGLDPAKDVSIIAVGGVATALAALEKNEIQAFIGFQPIQGQAIHGLKIAKTVVDFSKGEGPKLFQNYAFNSMVASQSYLDAHPDVARLMVQAIVDTERFMQNPANRGALMATAEKYFKGFDPALLRQILDETVAGYKPVLTREAIANVNQLLIFAKLIDQPIPFESVVDTRFAPTKF